MNLICVRENFNFASEIMKGIFLIPFMILELADEQPFSDSELNFEEFFLIKEGILHQKIVYLRIDS